MDNKLSNTYFIFLRIFCFSIPFIGFNIPRYILGGLVIFKIIEILKNIGEFVVVLKKYKKALFALLAIPIYYLITLTYSEDLINGFNMLGRFSYGFLIPFIFLN